MSGRGGRGGGGGRGGFTKKKPGTVTIGGTECKWDLDGIELPVKPLDHFPASAFPLKLLVAFISNTASRRSRNLCWQAHLPTTSAPR